MRSLNSQLIAWDRVLDVVLPKFNRPSLKEKPLQGELETRHHWGLSAVEFTQDHERFRLRALPKAFAYEFTGEAQAISALGGIAVATKPYVTKEGALFVQEGEHVFSLMPLGGGKRAIALTDTQAFKAGALLKTIHLSLNKVHGQAFTLHDRSDSIDWVALQKRDQKRDPFVAQHLLSIPGWLKPLKKIAHKKATLTHGAFTPQNVLFDDTVPVGLMGLSHSVYDGLERDLAIGLYSFSLRADGSTDDKNLRAFAAGYQEGFSHLRAKNLAERGQIEVALYALELSAKDRLALRENPRAHAGLCTWINKRL